MDYIESQGKLFVGTNKAQIMTIDISPLLELDNWYDYSPEKGFDQSIGKLSRVQDHHRLEHEGMDMEDMDDFEFMQENQREEDE